MCKAYLHDWDVWYCSGYVLTYSQAGNAPEIVQLLADVHHYIIEVTEPVEYTIDVAAATRHGSGPTRSRSGELVVTVYLLPVISGLPGIWNMMDDKMRCYSMYEMTSGELCSWMIGV